VVPNVADNDQNDESKTAVSTAAKVLEVDQNDYYRVEEKEP